MKNILIAIFLFICVSCASTKYIEKPVPVETIKTEYINQYYKDSIFIHDSIDRYISGDTVYQYKYKYIYKYYNHTDTVIKNDTIQIPVELKTTEIKEVNKLKWYLKFLMFIGIVLGIVGVFKLGMYIKDKVN